MPDHRGRRENGHKAYLVGFLVNWLNEKYSGLFGGAGGGLDKLTKGLLLSENDMRFIFKEINGINYDEMMMACYFAAAVEINREDQTARDIESIGLSTKSQSALSKELFEAKKKIRHLANRNAKLEEQVQRERDAYAKARKEEWDRKKYGKHNRKPETGLRRKGKAA